MKLRTALLAATLLASSTINSWAQQTVPAQMGLAPLDTPPGVYILDPTQNWVKMGTIQNGAWFDNHTIWSDDFLKVSGSDCGSLQAAYSVLRNTGGQVNLPNRILHLGSPCQVTVSGAAVTFHGQGWSESQGLGDGSNKPRYGTWLDISDTTNSLFAISTVNGAGTVVEDLALYGGNIQPSVTNNPWTPVTIPPVISATNTLGRLGVYNVYCVAVTTCVNFYGMGRLDIRGLWGDAFGPMITGDQIADVPWIDLVHDWPYWSFNNNVYAWDQANADVFQFGRVDGPMIGRVFGITKRSMFHFTNGTAKNQSVLRMFANQIYADHIKWTFYYDSSYVGSALAMDGHIGMLDAMHADATSNTAVAQSSGTLIHCDATANAACLITLQIDQARDEWADVSPLDLSNTTGINLTFGQLWADSWNYVNPLVKTSNIAGHGEYVNIKEFHDTALTQPILTNATSDEVTVNYSNWWGSGNGDLTRYANRGITDTTGGAILRNAGVITDTTTAGYWGITSAANAFINFDPGHTFILGPTGASACGIWMQPGYLLPGNANGSSAPCNTGNINIGAAAEPFGNAWFNGTMNAAQFSSGTNTGVSCSGAPTTNFKSVNGIVTQC